MNSATVDAIIAQTNDVEVQKFGEATKRVLSENVVSDKCEAGTFLQKLYYGMIAAREFFENTNGRLWNGEELERELQKIEKILKTSGGHAAHGTNIQPPKKPNAHGNTEKATKKPDAQTEKTPGKSNGRVTTKLDTVLSLVLAMVVYIRV